MDILECKNIERDDSPMPRQTRLDAPGALHHIMVRGINKAAIFNDDQDRQKFLERLGKTIVATKCAVYAWVLMTNHVHLLFKSGDKGISAVMRKQLSWYAQYFNQRHQRTGHLFENRYKSILCDEENYFLALIRYIHLNPVRAGIVATISELDRYPWCGHSVIIGKNSHCWMDVSYVLTQFGSGKNAAKSTYRSFVMEGMNQGRMPELTGGGLVRSKGGWSKVESARRSGKKEEYDERILGSGDFVNGVFKGLEEKARLQLKLRRAGGTISMIIDQECRENDVSMHELKDGSKRRKVSSLRMKIARRGLNELTGLVARGHRASRRCEHVRYRPGGQEVGRRGTDIMGSPFRTQRPPWVPLRFLTAIILLLYLTQFSFAQSTADYLILLDISSYTLDKSEKRLPGRRPTGGPEVYNNNSGVVGEVDHFSLDHADKTYKVWYVGGNGISSPTVFVTQHANVDSDKWLAHELDAGFRKADGIPSQAYSTRQINGQTVLVDSVGGREYRWISGSKIVMIEYHGSLRTMPEPMEVVQAYLTKHPSTLPNMTSADLRTVVNKTTWIKDEMDRRLWLCDKWFYQLQLQKVQQSEAFQAVVNSMNIFLDYREKYYRMKAEDEKNLLASYLYTNNGTLIKAKLDEYKKWWAVNKSGPINL